MSNLKRYGSPIISSDGFRASPIPEEDGEWVKFDDIKEFLKPAYNSASMTCCYYGPGCDCSYTDHIGWSKKCGSKPCEFVAKHHA